MFQNLRHLICSNLRPDNALGIPLGVWTKLKTDLYIVPEILADQMQAEARLSGRQDGHRTFLNLLNERLGSSRSNIISAGNTNPLLQDLRGPRDRQASHIRI